ncbi:hypothetical protein AB4059_00455 [Lysobacter sp. 2RAF19]
MQYDIPPGSARARFFNEEGNMLPPFRARGWRGCVLDRGTFDSTRMPRQLFDVLLALAAPGELLIERYAPDHLGPDRIAPDWDVYKAYTRAEETWSLEFVMYDADGRWALLADADATVLGAEPSLANQIDEQLALQGTSLKAMTEEEWGELDPLTQPGAKYILAVCVPSE